MAQRDQHERAESVADHGDPDQDLDQDEDADATATTPFTATPAATAASEASGAAAGRGECRRGEDQDGEGDRQSDEQDEALAGHALASAFAARGPIARLALGDVLVGVVAGAYERTRGNVLESELVRGIFELLELVGVPVTDDRAGGSRSASGIGRRSGPGRGFRGGCRAHRPSRRTTLPDRPSGRTSSLLHRRPFPWRFGGPGTSCRT